MLHVLGWLVLVIRRCDQWGFRCTNHMQVNVQNNCGLESLALCVHATKCWDPTTLRQVLDQHPPKLVGHLKNFEQRLLCCHAFS